MSVAADPPVHAWHCFHSVLMRHFWFEAPLCTYAVSNSFGDLKAFPHWQPHDWLSGSKCVSDAITSRKLERVGLVVLCVVAGVSGVELSVVFVLLQVSSCIISQQGILEAISNTWIWELQSVLGHWMLVIPSDTFLVR